VRSVSAHSAFARSLARPSFARSFVHSALAPWFTDSAFTDSAFTRSTFARSFVRAVFARSFAALAVAAALVACGGADASSRPAAPPPAPPSVDASAKTATASAAEAGAPDEPPPPEAPVPDAGPVDLAAWAAAAATIGIKPPPAACAAFARRRPAPSASAPACGDRAAAIARLDEVMRETDAAKRDAGLAALEPCAGLAPGWVRALRAELAPPACADVLADPLLRARAGRATGHVLHALAGLSIAGRLARAVGAAPKLTGPTDKKRLAAYFQGPFRRWVVDQARVVEDLARFGAKLSFYGRGVAAVEAGLADMRFVERARELPVPAEWAKDAELRDVYYGALDQALDPRKDRGRDAALVGLRDLAAVGVVHDARVDRARALLAKLYAGRRIDALDALLLPPLPPLAPSTADERLAAALPTFFAGELLDPAASIRAPVLRAHLVHGVPTRARAAAAGPDLAEDARPFAARAAVERGATYWIALDFARAAALAGAASGDDARLLAAVAQALRSGPRDAVEMMRAPSPAAFHVGSVAPLDAIAAGSGPSAARAAFDAAALLAVAPPDGAGAAFFRDLSRRYRAATAGLDGAEKAEAAARAASADATAEATK